MSRARNIKPGFFANEDLAECQPLARILFAGLWCEADREGRLEDRPKRLKKEILGYDNCDIEELLSELVRHGFIVRYQNGAGRFIAVLAFAKHQNPHKREAESTIPAPCESGASTVPDPDGTGTGPADSPSLIPDSLKEPTELRSVVSGKPPTPECPHAEIIAAYHETLPTLARIRDWTAQRQSLLRNAWRSKPERQTVAWWRDLFAYVAQSDFLTGKSRPRDGPPFEADLEWIVRPKNLPKILEGKYENRTGT